MSQMSGADADALDRLANELTNGASRVAMTNRRVGRTIHSAPWRGRGADQFRQQWSTQHSRALAEANVFLAQGSITLRINAQQQRDASLVGSSSDVSVRGPWSSDQLDLIAKVLGGLGVALDVARLDLPDVASLRNLVSKVGPSEFSALSLALFVTSLGLPAGSAERMGAEGLDHLFDIVSAGWSFASATNVPVARAVPVLGIIGGGLGIIHDVNQLQHHQGSEVANEISLAGNTMTVVGATIMLVPGGQVVGAGLLATGAITAGVSWAVEHHEEIEHFSSEALEAGGHAVEEIGNAVVRGVDKVVPNPIGLAHDLMRGLL